MASYVQLGQSGKVYKDPPPTGGKPPRKKKHKQNQQFAYILIALVLVLGIGAMAGTMIWLTSSNPNEPESLEDVSIDVRTTGTRGTGTHPTTPTTNKDYNPVIVTTRPTSAPTVHYVKGTSGSFAGNDDYKVKLIVEYGMVKNESGKEELQMQVYLQSYSLTLGKRNGTVTVNGKKTSFRSEEITIEENARTKTLLTTQALDSTQKELAIDVVWDLGITYSGVEIGDLTVSGVITL